MLHGLLRQSGLALASKSDDLEPTQQERMTEWEGTEGREGERAPLQSPQCSLLVQLFLGCQLLISLTCMFLGHGTLSSP